MAVAALGTVKVLQDGLFRAYVEILNRRKNKNKVINAFVRELNMLHANTSYLDLEAEFKQDINGAGTLFLSFIDKMGFKLVPKDA